MRSISSLLTLLPIIWCLDSGVVTATPSCVPNNSSDSVKVALRVLEFPAGQVDGSNEIFSLSRLPLGASVQVFEDGNELENDSAFHADTSNKVTLAKAPRPGQILQVAYCTQQINTSAGIAIAPDDARALIRTALIESVERDQPNVSDNHYPQQHSTVTHLGMPVRNIEPKSAFLSLLSRRMQNGDESAGRHSADPLYGFDGTGDASLTTPFAELIEENTLAPSQSVRGAGVSGVPRSLRLLQQRLAGATSVRRGSKPGEKP